MKENNTNNNANTSVIMDLSGDVVEITQEGLNDIKIKLDHLIKVERPLVKEQLSAARADGDLSENADYDSAKQKQGELEDEINKYEGIISKAKVVASSNKGVIKVGSEVKLKFSTGEKLVKIVSSVEIDPYSTPVRIGVDSPIGQAIIGQKIGTVVTISPNIGIDYKVTILEVK